MEQTRVIADLQERLRQIAARRPYRFRDTPRSVAEAYLAQQTVFEGFATPEVTAAEEALGGTFTAMFRLWMTTMGRRSGDLFLGSDQARPGDLVEWHEDLALARAEMGFPAPPAKAVVFQMHQGYEWTFTLADGGADAPVWRVTEMQAEPTRIADSFAAFLIAAADGLAEVTEMQRQSGGRYLSLQGGRVHSHYPARNKRPRPLDEDDIWPD